MTYWTGPNFETWVYNGCDIESAAEVNSLEMPTLNNGDIGLLKHFVNLRYLDLSFCDLSAIPEEVWELTQLEYLHIQHNNICEISPKIKNLTNLKSFDCRFNNLTTFPVEICQLTKLLEFNYADNQLDVLDPVVIEFLHKIDDVWETVMINNI